MKRHPPTFTLRFLYLVTLALFLPFLNACGESFKNSDYIEFHGVMPEGSTVKVKVKYHREEKPDGSCGKEESRVSGMKHIQKIGEPFHSESIDKTHYKVKVPTIKEGEGCMWVGKNFTISFVNIKHSFPAEKYNIEILEHSRIKLKLRGILANLHILPKKELESVGIEENLSPPHLFIACNVIYSFTGHKEFYSGTIGDCHAHKKDVETRNKFAYSRESLIANKKYQLDFIFNPEFWCSRCPERIKKGMGIIAKPKDKNKWIPKDILYQQLLEKNKEGFK